MKKSIVYFCSNESLFWLSYIDTELKDSKNQQKKKLDVKIEK